MRSDQNPTTRRIESPRGASFVGRTAPLSDGRYWARTSDPQLVERARELAASRRLSPKRVAERRLRPVRYPSLAICRHRFVPELFHEIPLPGWSRVQAAGAGGAGCAVATVFYRFPPNENRFRSRRTRRGTRLVDLGGAVDTPATA
jgi:hypothetical protein